jgi:hypothetical protein
VTRVWTDPLPTAEVERVAPNEDPELTSNVVHGMEALADLARQGGAALKAGLSALPSLYAQWIALEQAKVGSLDAPARRRTAQELVAAMQSAQARISAGIALLEANPIARDAFRLMNEAVAMAARRRNVGQKGDPAAQKPAWRPFQLTFILLNISGLADRLNLDREIVDLLFFPTGGGKTEAYRGLRDLLEAHQRPSPARRWRHCDHALHASPADTRSARPCRGRYLRASSLLKNLARGKGRRSNY